MKQVTLLICALSVIFQLYSMANAAPADLFGSLTNSFTNGASSLMQAPTSFITSATDIGKNTASAMTSAASSMPINPANMISTAISSGTGVASALGNTASTAANSATNAMPSGISGASGAFSSLISSNSNTDAMVTVSKGLSTSANILGSVANSFAEALSFKNGGKWTDRVNAFFDSIKAATSSVGTAMSG